MYVVHAPFVYRVNIFVGIYISRTYMHVVYVASVCELINISGSDSECIAICARSGIVLCVILAVYGTQRLAEAFANV